MTKESEHHRTATGDSGPDQNPFGDDRRLDAYYATPALQQRIDLTRHLLEFGRQIILITGPAQAGKSSMLGVLLEQHPETWVTIRLPGGPMLNAASLLNRLTIHLQVTPTGDDDQAAVIAAIRAKLVELDDVGKVPVLAIDDAETLPSDTHRLLVRLAHTEPASAELKVLMAANSQGSALLQSLRQNQPDQTLVHVIDLPKLGPTQTRALIEHRLGCSGFDIPFPFDDAAIERIHRQSGGIPGKVITLARQAFVARTREPTRSRTWSVPPGRVIFAAAIVIVVLGTAFWRLYEPEYEPSEPVQLALPTPPDRPATIVAPAPGTPDGPPPQTTDQAVTGLAAPGRDAVPPAPDSGFPHVPPVLAPSGGGSGVPELPATDPARAASTAVGPAVADVPQDLDGGTRAPGRGAAPTSEAHPPQVQGDDAIDREVEPDRVRSIPSDTPAKPKNSSDETVQAPTNSGSPYTLAWLRTQTPTGYVLQLFGVRDRKAAHDFITRHALEHETTVYETVFDGKPWYVVLFGHFQDRDAAQAAIAELSPELRRLKPWARPLHSLGGAP